MARWRYLRYFLVPGFNDDELSTRNHFDSFSCQVNRLTKRNSELETSVSSMEQQSKEMSNQKRDIEFAESEKSNKVRELEKQLKQTRLEKDDFSRDLTDAQGRNNNTIELLCII